MAVIGLGFGDEGKGKVVDALIPKMVNPLVVRYSGGQQAGHTVVHDRKHVFSNFGAGTLRGVPTYWSKHCTIDPIGVRNELSVLNGSASKVDLCIDEESMVTTPYDVTENLRLNSLSKHGSCGVGVGTTIARNEAMLNLRYRDLFYPSVLKIKLEQIKNYYNSPQIDLDNFLGAVNMITNSDKVYPGEESQYTYRDWVNIYEGSQGLLLDQDYGFFPHVTRSNVGFKRIRKIEDPQPEVYYVTRAYQTRHGNGPMTNYSIPLNLINNDDETNVDNYQGSFRTAVLDLDLLKYAIDCDRTESRTPISSEHLVITCMDQMTEFKLTLSGDLLIFPNEDEFIRMVAKTLGIIDNNVYLSYSPKSELKKWQTK